MNKKLKPALIGGVALGIASALPYVDTLCCALWVAGGMLASYLYLKDLSTPPASPYGDGAVVGLLAGSLGGVAAAFTNVLVRLSGYGEKELASTFEEIAQLEQDLGIELPSFVIDMMMPTGVSASMIFAMLVSYVVLYAILGTIGGLLGIAIFRKKDAT